MSILSALPPKLGELTTEEFRVRLACLTDPQEQLSPDQRDEQKMLAIEFIALLPELFGDELDRVTLWDRIPTGIQSAYAKTAGDDHQFFIQQVLEHIKASPAEAIRHAGLLKIIATLDSQESEQRQQFLAYMATHLIPLASYAKQRWEQRKADKKGNGNG